jgi:hypothetical protein
VVSDSASYDINSGKENLLLVSEILHGAKWTGDVCLGNTGISKLHSIPEVIMII